MNISPNSFPPHTPPSGGNRPPNNTGKTLLGVISIVVGSILLLAIVSGVIFLISRHNTDKKVNLDLREFSDEKFSKNEKIVMEEIRHKDKTATDTEENHSSDLYLQPKSYHANGYLADLPCSLDFAVNRDGLISGTFWNIFYDIKLQISGNIDSQGNLSLDLGTGSTLSHADLRATNGSNRFSGSWGKNRKPLSFSVFPGSRDLSLPGQSGIEFKIVGGGMTTRGHITSLGGSRYQLTYDNQPEINALPCTLSGSTFSIYSPDNTNRIAYFTLPGEGLHSPGTSSLYCCNGNVFEISII